MTSNYSLSPPPPSFIFSPVSIGISRSHLLWLWTLLLSSPIPWHSRSAVWRAGLFFFSFFLFLEQPLRSWKPAGVTFKTVSARQLLHTIWAQERRTIQRPSQPHTYTLSSSDRQKKEVRNITWNKTRLNKSDNGAKNDCNVCWIRAKNGQR